MDEEKKDGADTATVPGQSGGGSEEGMGGESEAQAGDKESAERAADRGSVADW